MKIAKEATGDGINEDDYHWRISWGRDAAEDDQGGVKRVSRMCLRGQGSSRANPAAFKNIHKCRRPTGHSQSSSFIQKSYHLRQAKLSFEEMSEY